MPAAAGHRVDVPDRPVGARDRARSPASTCRRRCADQHADPAGEPLADRRSRSSPRCGHHVRHAERPVDRPAASRGRPGRPWSGTAAGPCRRRRPRPGPGRSAAAAARGRPARSTTTSWSALATITRSTGSSSSAVRRSTVRALVDRDDPGQGAVVAGRVADQPHPVADHDALAAQRPGLHRHHDPVARPPSGRCTGRGRR